jgi:hypothetical protein
MIESADHRIVVAFPADALDFDASHFLLTPFSVSDLLLTGHPDIHGRVE